MSDHPPDDGDRDEAGAGGDRPDGDAPSLDDPFAGEAPPDDPDAGADSFDPDARDRDDAPLGDLARSVGERRRRRESEPDPFETVEVDDVDVDDLWASLGEAGADGPEPVPGAAATPSSPGDPSGGPGHVVDKRQYCQRCPFFSAPPTVACEHEGSEILEAVDPDRFRVRGCPMATDDGRPDFSAGEEPPAGVGTDPSTGEPTTRGVDVDGDAGAATDPRGGVGPADPDALEDPGDRADDA
ncbi:hypothetical protein [Halobaculum lipolyticum]|uniref:DUF8135 domain-containing protein n=1 Tax=Halobaculum lipolyticum TaxID=3032001 RepID=A0ABD5WCI1_9EURY|nr:hypothetical protein [Halobaculum sp. DT31]